MKLTAALAARLPRKPLPPDPRAVPGLTLDFAAHPMTWTVADGLLTTSIPAQPSANLSIDLTAYTLSSLVTYLNTQSGYSAVLLSSANGALGAQVLLDGSGSPQSGANGNRLDYFTSIKWGILDAFGRALQDARAALANMLQQMRLDQAVGEWSDFWRNATIGGMRLTGESDAQQNARTIATITRIKSTNKGLENLVLAQTGVVVSVRDINWFSQDNTAYTYGALPWLSSMLTNSTACGTYPDWGVDATVVADYGLTLLPWGPPAYGDPANNQPLLDAFAVIFPHGTSTDTRDSVMALVNKSRAGGTVALPYFFTDNTNTTFSVDGLPYIPGWVQHDTQFVSGDFAESRNGIASLGGVSVQIIVNSHYSGGFHYYPVSVTSGNTIDWTRHDLTTPIGSEFIPSAIAAGEALMCAAFQHNGTGTNQKFATTTDGVAWVDRGDGGFTNGIVNGMAYNGQTGASRQLVAVGYKAFSGAVPGVGLSLDDGATWAQQPTTGLPANYPIAVGHNRQAGASGLWGVLTPTFYANGGIYRTSDVTTGWTLAKDLHAGGYGSARTIVHNGLAGAAGLWMISCDYIPSVGGPGVITSPDLVTFTDHDIGLSGDATYINSVVYGTVPEGSMWIAGGTDGVNHQFSTSNDAGVTWIPRNDPVAAALMPGAYLGAIPNKFVININNSDPGGTIATLG